MRKTNTMYLVEAVSKVFCYGEDNVSTEPYFDLLFSSLYEARTFMTESSAIRFARLRKKTKTKGALRLLENDVIIVSFFDNEGTDIEYTYSIKKVKRVG